MVFFRGAEKRLKAAKALKEKGDTPEALLQSIKENEKAVAEAEKEVDAWKAIAGEKSRREEAAKAEAERIATEKAEAERKAAEERERAEKEEKARIEAEKKEAERIAAEKAEEEARVEAEKKAEEERKTKEEERKAKTDGDGQNGFNFFTGTIKELIAATRKKGSSLIKKVLSAASNRLIADLKDKGVDISPEYNHTIDNNAINHALNRHSSDKEKEQGQIPLTEKDIENVNDVIDNYDEIKTEKNSRGQDIIIYKKRYTDGTTLYVEEVRTGRKELAMASMRKQRSRKLTDADDQKSTPSSDLPSASADKGSKKAEKKQEKQSVFDKAKEIADKEENKRKAEAEDDSVLGQATRAVGKKKKVNLFKYTASKIISHPVLRGVHYANGYAYASDGYILFKEKADYPKEWEGTTRDKDGNLIDGKYPDTEKAIHRPVYIPDKEAVSLPSKEVLDFAIAASKKLEGEAIPVAIDGMFFNAVNLKKFLEAVASKGMDKVVYRHPMLYATNGKDEIIMMPIVNTLEGALDIADKMESVGLPKEQIDAWKAHIEAADKKMSLEDFKKAVENAKKEGVRHTEAEKPKEQPLTEAERKDAEEVAGALGYRVEWVDTMEENGTIDADKKVIRIAKDAENPLVQVLGHEVAHGVKRMDGGKFKALQKAAMEVVGEKEWNERIEKKRKLNAYAEGKLAEEVTCDIVGEALNDKDALKRLAESLRGEKGILARLRDAVARMVEYFKNRGDKEGVRRMKAADKLLAEFESALKEDVASGQANPEGVDRSVRENRNEKTELTAEERELRDNLVERMRKGGLDVVTDSEEMQRVIDTENERTRNMFVGEKGATEADKAEEVSTRLDNLSVARRMEEAGKDAKAIKMATGWERGTDGKWRYETGDAKIKDTIELDGKTFKRYDEDMLWTSGKFGDVIDAPELFKAYPELRDVHIETDAVLNDMPSNGEYNPRTNTITIHSDDLKYQNSILNHEIQHAIQHIEGFASGGNLRTPQLKDSKEYKDWQKMLDDARKPSFKEEDIQETINSLFKDYNDLDKKIREFLSEEETRMDGMGKSLLKSRQNRLEEIGREITELVDELEREGKKRGYVVKAVLDSEQSVLFNLYNRLAGEVEARNTEKRIGMTEEERRASLASETEDVAREDQILLGVDNADGEMNTGSVREHRVYHGSGADFDAFDHSHMGEGEGAQAYGWGTYLCDRGGRYRQDVCYS